MIKIVDSVAILKSLVWRICNEENNFWMVTKEDILTHPTRDTLHPKECNMVHSVPRDAIWYFESLEMQYSILHLKFRDAM